MGKAAVTQVILVLEVGVSPGASQGPDLSPAAGLTGMDTSVVLMPACGGHLGADAVSKGKDGMRKASDPGLFPCLPNLTLVPADLSPLTAGH